MATITLTKCQGTGNDFVLLDDRAGEPRAYPALARALCDRRFGIGADGLLVLRPADNGSADVAMRIFNADGSEAEMCGNGIRCAARYIGREAGADRPLNIETPAGVMRTQPVAPGSVRVAMGIPRLAKPLETTVAIDGKSVSVASVSMGNPHVVMFTDEPLDALALDSLATALSSLDAVNGDVNVEVATMVRGRVRMRVHERGVGETMACGTGACAVAAVAIATGRAGSPVIVGTRGGEVSVEWAGEGAQAYLTGDAELVFDTQVDVGANGRVRAISGRMDSTATT
jgi:diaminopimelate epimerase